MLIRVSTWLSQLTTQRSEPSQSTLTEHSSLRLRREDTLLRSIAQMPAKLSKNSKEEIARRTLKTFFSIHTNTSWHVLHRNRVFICLRSRKQLRSVFRQGSSASQTETSRRKSRLKIRNRGKYNNLNWFLIIYYAQALIHESVE